MCKEIKNMLFEVLTLAEASALWNLARSSLKKAIKYGKFKYDIDYRKSEGTILFLRSSIEREYGLCKESDPKIAKKQLEDKKNKRYKERKELLDKNFIGINVIDTFCVGKVSEFKSKENFLIHLKAKDKDINAKIEDIEIRGLSFRKYNKHIVFTILKKVSALSVEAFCVNKNL